jgi:hypothetical protein
MHVPGSILDLRPASPKPRGEGATPIVRAPEPPLDIVQHEPVAVEPDPVTYGFAEPEPVAFVTPEPPVLLEPEPAVFIAPEPACVEPIVKPLDVSAPVIATPAPVSAPATSTGNSASFEAALAAIRAAWARPESTTPAPAAPASPSGGGKPLAGSGEVDLTNEIDTLEDVIGADGSTPATADDNSADSKTPNGQRNGEKVRKRTEKPRGRRTRGADGHDGRDDWGVLDPNKYEFSALVNKLDEVTDSDEATTPATNRR